MNVSVQVYIVIIISVTLEKWKMFWEADKRN